MAWGKDHKASTREKILQSAARLFLNKGFDAVSIEQVMSSAGLTRGAFYAHFSSKNELYAESIVTAGVQSSKVLYCNADDNNVLKGIIDCYLDVKHRDGESATCPLAFLVTDITHRDDTVRDTYTQMFKGFVHKLEAQAAKQGRERSPESALKTAIMMIGGLALSRAINDAALSEQVLESCRQDDASIARSFPAKTASV